MKARKTEVREIDSETRIATSSLIAITPTGEISRLFFTPPLSNGEDIIGRAIRQKAYSVKIDLYFFFPSVSVFLAK